MPALTLQSTTVPFDYRGCRLVPKRMNGIKSFDISFNSGTYNARVNKSCLLGRFSTQELALGAVVGAFINSGGGSLEDISAAMDQQLSLSRSSLGNVVNRALWSVGTSLANVDEPYYRIPLNEGADNVMDEAIALIPGNSQLITIYPDKTNSMDSPWEDFSLVDKVVNSVTIPGWDGNPATLPQMDPAGYVTALDDAISSGYIPTLEGWGVLFDWEYGTTETQNLATTYWNDEDNPQFKVACIELRRQLGVVYDTVKAAYPNTFFGQYGSTCNFPNGNLRYKTQADVDAAGSGTVNHLSYEGSNARGRLQASQNADQTLQVNQNAIDAMTNTVMKWDYTSLVCYDIFGGDALARQAEAEAELNGFEYQFLSTDRPSYRIENCAWSFDKLKTQYPDVPALGIISPSNVASSFNDVRPSPNTYGWAEPFDFVDVTIACLQGSDGYLIWDNLLMDQEKHYLENYNDWANVGTANQQAERLDDWSMMESMEARFGYLTAFETLFPGAYDNCPGPLPASPQEWFDHVDREDRRSAASFNLFVKFISESWRDEMIPLLEHHRTTGRLPYAVRNASTVTGSAVVGSTLTAVTDFAGEALTVDYRWRNSASSTDIGTSSTYVVRASDAGETIECLIRVLDTTGSSTIVHENITVTTASVPMPAPTMINNDFGNPALGQITFGALDVAKMTTSTLTSQGAVGTAVSGSTMNISFGGALGSDWLIDTNSVLTFTFPDTTVIAVSPLSVAGAAITIAAGPFVTKVASSATGDVVTLEVTP